MKRKWEVCPICGSAIFLTKDGLIPIHGGIPACDASKRNYEWLVHDTKQLDAWEREKQDD